MLDTNLNHNGKEQQAEIMVLLRKSCPFKLVEHKDATSNCLCVQLQSASNQELKIAFVYNPNDETNKISNLSKALDHHVCSALNGVGRLFSRPSAATPTDFMHSLIGPNWTKFGHQMILELRHIAS